MSISISKNYDNMKKFFEFDLEYYRTENPENLDFENKKKRLETLICLHKQNKNRFDKNNLNNLKDIVYNDLSILGKTQLDLYKSDINWNRL